MGFIENLNTCMKTMGLSSYELGKVIDISSQTIRNWLNGTSVPSDKNIYKIATYFGTTIENMKANIREFESRLPLFLFQNSLFYS